MTTAVEYMTAAINHAEGRRAELEKERGEPVFAAAGWVETPAGTLKVYMDQVERRTTLRMPHYRKRWELAGRRIAAGKIADAIFADA